MLNQIQLLESRLKDIGFEIIAHENVLQIIAITKKKSETLSNRDEDSDADEGHEIMDLDKISHVIQVVIEL